MSIEKTYYIEPTKEAQAAVRILRQISRYSEMTWNDGKLHIVCPISELGFIERTLTPFM